jgi:hypothetical protein
METKSDQSIPRPPPLPLKERSRTWLIALFCFPLIALLFITPFYFKDFGKNRPTMSPSKGARPVPTIPIINNPIVVSTRQSAGGAKDSDFNQESLAQMEQWAVGTIIKRAKKSFLEFGQDPQDFKPKVTSNSTCVNMEGKRFVVIRVTMNDNIQAVMIIGIIGTELRRVTCIQERSDGIPLFQGEFGRKIKEEFDLNVIPIT